MPWNQPLALGGVQLLRGKRQKVGETEHTGALRLWWLVRPCRAQWHLGKKLDLGSQ